MEQGDIPVTSQKHIETYFQTITPRTQDEVPAIVDALRTIAKNDKVTGRIQLNLKQGGVRSIDVESTETRVVPAGK